MKNQCAVEISLDAHLRRLEEEDAQRDAREERVEDVFLGLMKTTHAEYTWRKVRDAIFDIAEDFTDDEWKRLAISQACYPESFLSKKISGYWEQKAMAAAEAAVPLDWVPDVEV